MDKIAEYLVKEKDFDKLFMKSGAVTSHLFKKWSAVEKENTEDIKEIYENHKKRNQRNPSGENLLSEKDHEIHRFCAYAIFTLIRSIQGEEIQSKKRGWIARIFTPFS